MVLYSSYMQYGGRIFSFKRRIFAEQTVLGRVFPTALFEMRRTTRLDWKAAAQQRCFDLLFPKNGMETGDPEDVCHKETEPEVGHRKGHRKGHRWDFPRPLAQCAPSPPQRFVGRAHKDDLTSSSSSSSSSEDGDDSDWGAGNRRRTQHNGRAGATATATANVRGRCAPFFGSSLHGE